MNIVFYAPSLFKNEKSEFDNFIVETFFLFVQQNPENRFIIITDKRPEEQFSFHANSDIVVVKLTPKNALLKKLWWDVRLPGILKKLKAELFISVDNICSLTISIPQCIIVGDRERIKGANVKKAQLLIVTDKLTKKELTEKYKIPGEKISVIYPSANKMYEVINSEEKDGIKNKYCDGKEFFLYNSNFSDPKDFVTLLKSFSHFKKRQQSGFKLLLTTASNPFFEKSLAGYKYRNDVSFINTKDKKTLALITASAYTVVLPFNRNEEFMAALNALRSGVPVISIKDSVISEVAGDAVLYAETGTIKDIGEKMMQVYTDEDVRFRLIEKGKQAAAIYTYEKAAELLRQSISKVLQ